MQLLACSGPGALATIASNITFSRCLALIVGILTMASLTLWARINRRRRYPIICFLLLALHPAWTMSATRGDCGGCMVLSSMCALGIASIAVILQVIFALRNVAKESF